MAGRQPRFDIIPDWVGGSTVQTRPHSPDEELEWKASTITRHDNKISGKLAKLMRFIILL